MYAEKTTLLATEASTCVFGLPNVLFVLVLHLLKVDQQNYFFRLLRFNSLFRKFPDTPACA